jgi:hypothetical protein
MNQKFYSCISITVAEWQTWKLFRELRTSASRWVDLELDENGKVSDTKTITEVFSRAPDLHSDFEQEILIVLGKRIDDNSFKKIVDGRDDIYYCSFDVVIGVFSVTERNTKILEGRGLELEKPLFEQNWLKFRSDDDIRRSLNNGNYFSYLEKDEVSIHSVIKGQKIKDQVVNALGLRFYPDIIENDWVSSSISELFSFQRKFTIAGGNDPTPSHTDLDYCINLGLLARRRLGKELTEGFKSYGEYLNKVKNVDDLVAFVLNPEVEVICDKIQNNEQREFLLRPEAYLLFLKWKEKKFENSKIEWEDVQSDLKPLLEANRRAICRQSLFLLTCYAGPSSLSNLPADFRSFTNNLFSPSKTDEIITSSYKELIIKIILFVSSIFILLIYSLF